MKEMVLTYKRWGLRHTTRTSIPESWGDLTSIQMTMVAALHLRGGDIIPVIAMLCSVKEKIVRRMDDYQRYVLSEQLEWVRSLDRPCDRFIIERLPGTDLIAPGERLRGCSLQQYMTADTFFQLFTLHPDEEQYLNQFVAALYLRDGERYIEQMESVDMDVRFAVYLNFVLVRVWLSNAYPYLFPRGEVEEEKGTKATKPTDWLAVFDAFVGDDVAEMKKYQAMAATDAFRIMNRRIKNNMNRK